MFVCIKSGIAQRNHQSEASSDKPRDRESRTGRGPARQCERETDHRAIDEPERSTLHTRRDGCDPEEYNIEEFGWHQKRERCSEGRER